MNPSDPLGKQGRKAVAVFASSRGNSAEARELGELLAGRGYLTVTGGGPGHMVSIAEGVRSKGGETVAVIPESTNTTRPELLARTVVRPTLLSRIVCFIEQADAFIALEGGTGTLAEFALAWEYVNKGLTGPKPIIIVGPFWNPIVSLLHREPGAADPTGLATAATQHVHRAKNPLEAVTILGLRLGK